MRRCSIPTARGCRPPAPPRRPSGRVLAAELVLRHVGERHMPGHFAAGRNENDYIVALDSEATNGLLTRTPAQAIRITDSFDASLQILNRESCGSGRLFVLTHWIRRFIQ